MKASRATRRRQQRTAHVPRIRTPHGRIIVLSDGVPVVRARPRQEETDWADSVLHAICLLFLVMLVAAAAMLAMLFHSTWRLPPTLLALLSFYPSRPLPTT